MRPMEHTRQGSGEPLLLIHFQGGHAGSWAPVAERLAAAFEVWTVSLPGFGRTPPLGEPPTLAALARAVAGFMAGQGRERFHVAGCSLGGAVALELGRP
jgi:pimeloyl-ACP methyl ester carboxylesterase